MATKLSSTQMACASRLFSSVVIQEMARYAFSPTFGRLASQAGVPINSDDTRVAEYYEVAFSQLRRESFRYEYIYKNAIAHKLLMGVHSLKTASMLTEFRVGSSKADLVILNGTSTVYEVKSERDNTDRLQGQIEDYRRVFASVNVISADVHLKAVENCVPKDVGILVLNNRYQISTVREAKASLEFIDPCAVFESVKKSEALEILNRLGVPCPEVPNTKFHAEVSKIFAKLDCGELHECMLRVLKEKRSLQSIQDLVCEMPKSLYMAIIASPVRPRDYGNLIAALNTPISEALAWA